tara:strand:- start:57 stop:455 length:399 start_codon:yes stop_codon:yes gene_type:complete
MITTSWNEVEYTAADGQVYVKYVASNIDELYAEGERQAAENAANPTNEIAKTLVGLTTAQAVQLRLDNYTDLLRQTRNQLLLESDWTQGADSVLNSTKKAEWQTYRQSLRDITSGISSVTDVENITWPTKPS